MAECVACATRDRAQGYALMGFWVEQQRDEPGTSDLPDALASLILPTRSWRSYARLNCAEVRPPSAGPAEPLLSNSSRQSGVPSQNICSTWAWTLKMAIDILPALTLIYTPSPARGQPTRGVLNSTVAWGVSTTRVQHCTNAPMMNTQALRTQMISHLRLGGT